ncbi:MAG: hypothetical protein MJA83_06815, partial [Gammaproteobacteria bacterium]|nr:hypothetical protein [Gammaproteobacteria bacterium]
MSDKAAPFYKRINWLVLTAETIAIVFGVLLALGVDEWREENQIQKNIERARARLTTEVIANRNEL